MTFMVNNPPVWPNSNNFAKQSGAKSLHNNVKDSLVFITLSQPGRLGQFFFFFYMKSLFKKFVFTQFIFVYFIHLNFGCEKRSPTHMLFKPSNVRGIQLEKKEGILKGRGAKTDERVQQLKNMELEMSTIGILILKT